MRHADKETMDHIIALRKRIAELEKQNKNYSDYAGRVYASLTDIKRIIRHCDEPNQPILNAIEKALVGL